MVTKVTKEDYAELWQKYFNAQVRANSYALDYDNKFVIKPVPVSVREAVVHVSGNDTD